MKQRIITGIFLVLIIVPIILFDKTDSGIFFNSMMIFFVIMGSHEMFNMFSRKKVFPLPQRVICIILSVVSYLTLAISWSANENGFVSSFPIYVAIVLLQMLILFGMLVIYEDFDGEDVGKGLMVINYVALGCASMTILWGLGVRFLVYLLIVTFSTDVFAYFFGVLFGKHKMCPKISPKKSWEGAFAGTAFATLFGTVFAFFYGDLFSYELFNAEGYSTLLDNFCSLGTNQDVPQLFVIIVITFLASILSQIGDLVASKLKRSYDIKDFGKIFPGHGGVLDRFDSSIFVAMFLIAIFTILQYFFPI